MMLQGVAGTFIILNIGLFEKKKFVKIEQSFLLEAADALGYS